MKENIKDIKAQKALDDEGLDKVVGGANAEVAAMLRQNAEEAVQGVSDLLQNSAAPMVSSIPGKEFGLVKKPEVR